MILVTDNSLIRFQDIMSQINRFIDSSKQERKKAELKSDRILEPDDVKTVVVNSFKLYGINQEGKI